jgi:hypothetical protein
MTNPERIEALRRLGYTEREAAFLCLAALQGGYFLRRHYCDFIGKEIGGTAATLIEKLLTQQHAAAITAFNNTKIYHLGSRPFYQAIGEPDNRNRREHSPALIKNRLLSLDFVLAHRDYRYLATEREKLDYFSGTLEIALSSLPYKRYISLKTTSSTIRYFVDKYPIFLSDISVTAPPSATTCFCFVDQGSLTLSAFETYLDQYSPLWRLLSDFHIIYVADSRRLFARAERCFLAFLSQLEGSGNNRDVRLTRRMLQHFEARRLYEKSELGSFSRAKLIQLRNETDEFSGPEYQAFYERWKTVQVQASPKVSGANARLPMAAKATFSTFLVEHPYDFFGKTCGRNELSTAADGPTPRAVRGVGAVVGSP